MYLLFLFLLGLAVGSFANVLIDRLPKEQSIGGRSRCDYCKKILKPRDLIPVFSYIATRGKTRCCQKHLTLRYPFIELLTGVMYVFIWGFTSSQFNLSPLMQILILGIATSLLVIVFADLQYQIIPDEMQIGFFIFAFALKLAFKEMPVQMLQSVINGLLVALPIFLLYFFSKGNAMGFGDVKLAGIMGFLLGIKFGFMALYIAFLSGAVVGVILLVSKKKRLKSAVPFGPFLILGTVAVFIFQKEINTFLQYWFP